MDMKTVRHANAFTYTTLAITRACDKVDDNLVGIYRNCISDSKIALNLKICRNTCFKIYKNVLSVHCVEDLFI